MKISALILLSVLAFAKITIEVSCPAFLLSNVTRTGLLAVKGFTTTPATLVTVNGLEAGRYSDGTFVYGGFTNWNTTYTAIAADALGRGDTNSIAVDYPATVSFSYDANGNMTSDGLRGFEYDDENQLTRVTVTNVSKSEFVYDGFNRRRITREYQWKSSAWAQTSEVREIYDGLLPIQERDGNYVPRVTYTRGPDLSGTLQGAGGIGGLLARTDHSSLTPYHSFYHADGSGNVTMLLNSQERPVAWYLYDSFGNTLAESGPLAAANNKQFSSQTKHGPSGMYGYLRRWYIPGLQRWLNQDPIGEAGGLNLYAFAGNSSLNRIDPFGEAPPLVAFCAAAAIDYVAEKSLDFVGNNMVPDQHQETFDKVRSAYDTLSALTPAKTGRKMAGEVLDAGKNLFDKAKRSWVGAAQETRHRLKRENDSHKRKSENFLQLTAIKMRVCSDQIRAAWNSSSRKST